MTAALVTRRNWYDDNMRSKKGICERANVSKVEGGR